MPSGSQQSWRLNGHAGIMINFIYETKRPHARIMHRLSHVLNPNAGRNLESYESRIKPLNDYKNLRSIYAEELARQHVFITKMACGYHNFHHYI